MTITRSMPASVAPLMLLLACGIESEPSIAGILAASRTSSFSAWSEPVSLNAPINTTSNELQTTLSQDGLTLYFASNRPGSLGGLDIWVAHRAHLAAPWGEAVNLGSAVNTASGEFAPALSRDGHWLFIASGRPGGFGSTDIWAFRRDNVHDDFGWQAPVNLGSGVNTAGFQGGPGYFENDEVGVPQLYYNHNDEPVNTGGDIYVTEQAADGSWGPGTPVLEVNSPASEQRPSVAPSGLDIYFFSNRSGSVPDATGVPSMDIWRSTRESVTEPWSPPTNLGAPFNTAAAEQHPFIFSHGRTEALYFARGAVGALDLYVSTRTRKGMGRE